MNYSYHILKLGLRDETNTDGEVNENSVVEIQWKKIATDTDGITASYVGKTLVSSESTSSSDFVALADLTKDIVLNWVMSDISAKQDKINNTLQNKIDKKKTTFTTPNWN